MHNIRNGSELTSFFCDSTGCPLSVFPVENIVELGLLPPGPVLSINPCLEKLIKSMSKK